MVRDTLLIIDDSELDLAILNEIFKHMFRVQCFQDAHKALSFIKEHSNQICGALLDICLGRRGAGFTVLQRMQTDPDAAGLPIILITSDANKEYVVRGIKNGAADFLVKPVEPHSVQERVCTVVRASWPAGTTILDGAAPNQEEEAASEPSESGSGDVVQLAAAWGRSLALFFQGRGLEPSPSPEVRELTALLAHTWCTLFPDSGFGTAEAEYTAQAAALCDIGMLGMPDGAASLEEPETPAERQAYFRHVELGRAFFDESGMTHPFLTICRDMAYWHHKNYDGTGYPPTEGAVTVPLSAQFFHAALRCDRYIRKYLDNGDCCDRVIRALAAEAGHIISQEMYCTAEAAHTQMENIISRYY